MSVFSTELAAGALGTVFYGTYDMFFMFGICHDFWYTVKNTNLCRDADCVWVEIGSAYFVRGCILFYKCLGRLGSLGVQPEL